MATAERDIRDHSKTLTEIVTQLGRVLAYQEDDRVSKAREDEREKSLERRLKQQDDAIEAVKKQVDAGFADIRAGVSKIQWIIIGAFVTAVVILFANQWLFPKV